MGKPVRKMIYKWWLYPIGSMVLLYMVCHGSHQEIPPVNVSINIGAPWILYGIYIYIDRYMMIHGCVGRFRRTVQKRYDGMMGNNHSTHRNCHFGM